MKNSKLFALFSAPFFAIISGHGQSAFGDLDFESATLSPIPSGQFGGDVQISSALPGWNASIGGLPVTQVLQNNYTLGEASVDIFGPNWGPAGPTHGSTPGVIDGNYTVFLQSGANPQGGSAGVNTSLWQTGTIPANAQSLQFKAWSWQYSSFSVSFAGNSLSPVVLLGSGPNYDLYGVNVAPDAGQTGELEFTSIFTGQGASWTELDDINFSPTAVPEPTTLALILMGGLALAARRWRAKRS